MSTSYVGFKYILELEPAISVNLLALSEAVDDLREHFPSN